MYIALYQPIGQHNEEKLALVLEQLNISPTRIDRFHPSSNAIGAIPDQKGCYSWCKPLQQDCYDAIVFLPGSRLYPNAWSKALLVHCLSARKTSNGKLVIPFAITKAEVDSGLIQLSQLSETLGTPERVIGELALFGASITGKKLPTSTLSWFLSNWGRAYFYFSEFQGIESRAPDAIRHFFNERPALRSEVFASKSKNLTADFLSQDHESLVRFLVFSVFGVNSKSRVLAKILRNASRRSNIKWADIGGGAGLLGLELLLDTPCIASVTNFEKSPAQAMIGVEASTTFPREISSRYLTRICRVDDSEFAFQGAGSKIKCNTLIRCCDEETIRTS